MVSQVPYPMTVPKYYAVASKVATIQYMCSFVLPLPKIYGYSPDSDNAAGTGHILMESVQGSKLSKIWRGLNNEEVISAIRQLTQLESRMISLSLSLPVEAYISAKTWIRLSRGWVYCWTTRISALVLIQDCRCGMGEKLEGPCRSFSVFS